MPIVLDLKKGDYPKFSQAQEDIEIFKVVTKHSGGIYSLFYPHIRYGSGDLLIKQEKKVGLFTRFPGKTKSREFVVSSAGLYSYKDLKMATKIFNLHVDLPIKTKAEYAVVCIVGGYIPQGSFYLEHKGNIISNNLILRNQILRA